MTKISNALAMARAHGFLPILQETAFRLINRFDDKRLGIETRGSVGTDELGYLSAELVHYSPIGYQALRDALKRLDLNWRECSFLDYGCGKGRAIAIAARLPFRRITGIELSQPLIDQAHKNVATLRGQRAPIELRLADATQFEVPADVNVIYFYNPFRGAVLERVWKNILESQRKSPRRIHIVFFNHDHFDKLIASNNRICKTDERRVYPGLGQALYLLEP